MSEATERLLVRIDATTEQLRRELKRADKAVADTSSTVDKAVAKMSARWKSADKWVVKHSTSIKLLGAAAVASAGLAVKTIAGYSDRYQQLQGQLKLVTGSQDELNSVWQQSLALSNATGASLDSTVNLYARLARSTEELGLSQEQLFTITKAVNQSFVVSGASAQEADSAILQLSQGLAAGALRGEELNSVMENSPRLARALADGLGKSIGELREMGKAGELTAETVTGALLAMSGSISSEFDEMPMTVARATNQIENLLADAFGKADLSPLIDGLEEFAAVISDPRIVQGLTELAGAVAELGAHVVTAMAHIPNFFRWITGNAKDLGSLYESLYEKESQLENMRNKRSPQARELRKEIEALNKQIEEETARILDRNDAQKEGAKTEKAITKERAKIVAVSKDYSKVLKEIGKAQVTATKQHEKNTKSLEKSYEALDEMVRAGDEYIEQQEYEIELLGMTAREQAIANAMREAGTRITDEHAEAIRKNAAAMYDIEQAADQAAQATAQMEQAWASSRDTLSDFFFEFARDGKDAFDTLVDGFKAMIAKMIAEAAANQIILGIGGAAAGLGFSGVANAAASSVSGGLSSLSGLAGSAGSAYFGGASGLAGAVAGAYGGVGSTLSSLYYGNGALAGNSLISNAAMNSYTTGAQYAQGGWGAAGYGAMNVGAGLAGSYIGGQAFGETSGIGGAAGGLVGSIWGPIGAGIGSFIGTGLERALGNVFGFGGKPGNNIGFADLNTGETGGYGNYEVDNLNAAKEIAAQIQVIAGALGAEGVDGRIEVSSRGWVRLQGEKYTEVEELFSAVIDQIIDKSKTLTGPIKALVKGFDGTTEELITFASAMVSIGDMLEQNPVDVAVRDFAEAQAAAGRTMMDTYRGQLDAIYDLTWGFDGSIDATVSLNNAMSTNAQLAYQMATALQSIGDSTKTMVSGEVDYFNEAVRTPDESLQYMEDQLKFLDALIPTLTDPEQIVAARDKALELNRAVFDAGPDDLQLSNVSTFTDYAQRIGELTAEALKSSQWELGESQRDLNTQVAGMLEVAASEFQAPADTMYSAAELMYLAVQNFINNGGQYNEVVA